MRNFIHPGRTLDYTPSAAVAAGTAVLIGTVLGIVAADIAANALGAVDVQGVFSIPVKASTTAAQGVAAYWDDTNKYITITPTSNTLVGYFAKACGSSDTAAIVKLKG